MNDFVRHSVEPGTRTERIGFSVIIPTLNEERYIGSLLESLAVQTAKNFEVIIVDAGSEDRTRQVAESFRDRFRRFLFVTESNKGLGRARNVGASYASSDLFVFMEADCVVERDFFEVVLAESRDRKAGCANVLSRPLSNRLFDRLYYKLLLNYIVQITQFFFPIITGYFILVKRSVFERLHGFDDLITFEDTEFAQRARKVTRFCILKKRRLYTSVRRLDRDGRFRCLLRSFLVSFYQFFFGHIRINPRIYDFGYQDHREDHARIVRETLPETFPVQGPSTREDSSRAS